MRTTSRNLLVKCLLVTGLALSGASANARDADEVYVVSGVGSNSCAKMTTDVSKYSEASKAYASYIDGFFTAINTAVRGKENYLEGTDGESRYKFVLKYCENNPVDNVIQAIHALYVKVAGSRPEDLAKPPNSCPPVNLKPKR